MVYRIYSEKRAEFSEAANALANDIRDFLGIKGLSGVRIVNRYDVEGVDEATIEKCVPTVFSEPQVDNVSFELAPEGTVFAVEYLPGQFDQRADSAAQCISLVATCERPAVRSAV
ncbi:MAG: phosphoribosylformylglycinamidine synthase, partial [Clostridia bacterium]|nr:phosphoribosylformylglycinamidine synthase [Clostridia bacterium]